MLLGILDAMNEMIAHDLDVCHVIPDGRHVKSDGLHLMYYLWNLRDHDRRWTF